MSRINEIQQKILELEGGAYQKLIDEYLYAKYKFPNIHPLGVQTGTNKPTKGVPDSYIHTDNDKYILICYGSVKEQAAKKIEKDILDCLNKSKSFISEDRIDKIICGYTSTNVNIRQFEDLKNLLDSKGIKIELIGIGTLSHDLVWRYPSIAFDHLGVPIDTRQIFGIEDFIKEYDKNGMNAPLATKFYFRETKLEDVSDSIKKNKITVITGPSGIGKTRLVLEVCRSFEAEGWKAFCVRSNGSSLYGDVQRYLDSCDKYLFFIDDANDVIKLDSLLKFLFSFKHVGELKILLTVRDYAKNRIITDVKNYNYNEIELEKIADDEIKEILKNNYNIKNPEYLKAIAEVANGNIRLAVLAGCRAIKSGFASIRNAEEIFKNYYDPIIDNADLKKSDLIYLCFLALLGPVMYKQDSFFQEIRNLHLHINNVDEEETLEKLYDLEIIEWFENEIAKISDQSFGNYILYYVIYEKKWINLAFLIEKMMPSRRRKIIYALNTLIGLFQTDGVKIYIEENINEAWSHADDEMEKYYVESFYSVNPIKGLCYLKKYVTEEKAAEFDLKTLDIKSKQNNNTISKKEIEILSQYKRTEYFKDAIDLLLALYAKRPDLFMDFFFAIKNNILFNRNSFYSKYSSEIEFLEELWNSCKSGKEYNNTILYLYIAKEFLKTEFTITGQERGGKISWCRMHVVVCDEIKSLRNNIWKSLNVLYNKHEYHDIVVDLLSNFRINGLKVDDRVALYQSDFDAIYKIFENKTTLDFDDALVLSHFKSVLTLIGENNDEKFKRLETCYEYLVYELLTIGDLTTGTLAELEKRRDDRILSIVQTYKLQDYKRMFKACHVIEKNWRGKTSGIGLGIAKVFKVLESDIHQYVNVVAEYVKNGAPYGDMQDRIVSCMIYSIGYEETFEFINNAEFAAKNQWLFSLWIAIPEEVVTDSIAQECINFQRQQLRNKENPIVLSVLQIKRYLKYDKNILKEIADFLTANPNHIHSFFAVACRADEIAVIEEVFKDNMDLLEKLYFACNNRIYDLDGNLFWLLYKNNEIDVWEKFVTIIKNSDAYNDGHYFRNIFRKIWKESNYSARIDYAFKELIIGTYGLRQNEMAMIFSKEEKDDPDERKKKQWIWDKMNSESKNLSTVIDLIDVVVNIYPLWRNDIVIHFLEMDKDIEHFKKINFFKMTDGWVGSEIPMISDEIDSLKDLNSKIKGIDYIEHKDYLEKRIKQLQEYKKNVAIREYIEHGMY